MSATVRRNRREPGALAARRRLTRPGGIVAARDRDYRSFVWTPVASRKELADVAGGFRAWAERPDSTFVLLHGEVIARSPSSVRSDQ